MPRTWRATTKNGEPGRRLHALTGGGTDVCVLAAAMGAIDLGYRVVVVCDAF
ncbi:isochorismatase family protein [Rhizobium indigoferae]|uniref:isochorismatase family protein n=1 Tax=Rhizobium indigoferae TaxID=158891 RepID=UPI00235CDFB3|nr:hypothetical protein GCM10007919_16040 [Rhizobium indigoferae]